MRSDMKRRFKLLVTTLLQLAIVATAVADNKDAEQLFQKGNILYEKAQYKEAIPVYEEVVKSGFVNGELYYNLGNAYFKISDIPSAILNYERAKRFLPKDDDVDFNLRMANARVTDKIEPIPIPFYESWWNSLLNVFSADGWAYLSVFLVWLFCGSVVLFFFFREPVWKRIFFYSGLVSLLFFVFSFVIANSKLNLEENYKEAVIFANSSYIKSSPSIKSTDLFILHEGTKAQVLDKIADWYKIRLANGNVGWIKERDVQII